MTLTLTQCTYAYGLRTRPIFDGFDYALPDGLTILLGPNGAGKTTLLRLAAGATRPRRGSITLDGTDSRHKSFRAAVAWMPQQITAMSGLTAREQVAYTGWLKGMSRRAAWDEAGRALHRVDLGDSADKKTKHLSGGQLRRVGVASALVHSARVLLLDEPTAGMDPHQRRIFRDALNALTGDVRVLLSTHDVVDLAEESDNVTVLHSGHLTYTGTTAGFLAHAPADAAPGRTAEAAYTALGTAPQGQGPQQQ
ncbi:ATP-binding cassette domain-containing protein [Streptomyces sp. NPDC006992]|uniref:ATP-binding cassette domain-containing protein n=1 Tax=Streptomyces sp. NPDC006992 TaxID=3155601 RepID=UPI003403B8CE